MTRKPLYANANDKVGAVRVRSAEEIFDEKDAQIAALKEEARRWYNADGTFEILESAEAVVERRKAAAVRLAQADDLAASVVALRKGLAEANSVLAFYRDRAMDEEGEPMPELAEKCQGVIQPLLDAIPETGLGKPRVCDAGHRMEL